MMYGLIYSALNTANGKRYIGKTVRSIKERRKAHLYRTSNSHFSNALRENSGKFLWVIVDTAMDIQELNHKEQFWIQHYNTSDRRYGYNKTGGGDGGTMPTMATRRKLSTIGKNRVLSDEHKRRIGLAHKGKSNHREGTKHSPETILKMSEARKRFYNAKRLQNDHS